MNPVTKTHKPVTPGTVYCAFCTDEFCAGDRDEAAIRLAFTVVPHVQAGSFNGQAIAGIMALPCCLDHRKKQVSASESRLFRV